LAPVARRSSSTADAAPTRRTDNDALRWRRPVAYAVITAVLAVVGIVPLVLDRDSFPISTYPMFSTRRSTAETVDTAVAVDADGTVRRLGPQRIAGTDEIILATATVSGAINAGTVDQLCTEIADRVAGDGPDTAVGVEVVTERFDAIRWYRGDHMPIDRVVHATCPVPGRPA
jgi:hypothetical protein